MYFNVLSKRAKSPSGRNEGDRNHRSPALSGDLILMAVTVTVECLSYNLFMFS